jgi:hypothetical protein
MVKCSIGKELKNLFKYRWRKKRDASLNREKIGNGGSPLGGSIKKKNYRRINGQKL